jgi:phosphoglycerate dehydrogenase-like enzyme
MTHVIDQTRTWTCAKGAYAQPVAEHALTLALAGLRQLPTRIAARSWGSQGGTSLFGQRVTIVGGGGIAQSLLELLSPFEITATVVNRSGAPVPGAARTVPVSDLHGVLPGALVVFLALSLTPETREIIGAEELRLMDDAAWLINVARGGHVETDALVDALRERVIAGAALDVTDPEPLPDAHPLWDLPDCIITPHTADTIGMVLPLLAERIQTNVTRFAAEQPLLGLVDAEAGY